MVFSKFKNIKNEQYQLYIPKKINVGYQKREDTYTKKLGYVIYYDDKGVLRKEQSWKNWRDKSIKNEEFLKCYHKILL